MAWECYLDTELSIVTIKYLDIVSKSELFEALDSAVKIAFQNNVTLFLADCRQLKGGHSVFDLYELISSIDGIRQGQSFKEAVLFQSNKWLFKEVLFFETVCYNKGYSVKAFNDETKAINWLLQKMI